MAKGIEIKKEMSIMPKNRAFEKSEQIPSELTERKEPDFDADPFLHVDKWAPETPEETPTDLAHQHDHYLYGIEKIAEE